MANQLNHSGSLNYTRENTYLFSELPFTYKKGCNFWLDPWSIYLIHFSEWKKHVRFYKTKNALTSTPSPPSPDIRTSEDAIRRMASCPKTYSWREYRDSSMSCWDPLAAIFCKKKIYIYISNQQQRCTITSQMQFQCKNSSVHRLSSTIKFS